MLTIDESHPRAIGLLLACGALLAACTAAPGAVSTAVPPARPATQADASLAPHDDVNGEDAVMLRLADLKDKAECITSGEALLEYPSEEDRRQVDEEVAGGRLVNGRDSKGRVVGDATDVVDAYGGTEVLEDNGREVWFMVTKDGSAPIGMGFIAVPTPAGNTVWLELFNAKSDRCP